MEVSLLQEDIDRGTPSSHTHCAFGFAIRRASGEHEVFTYLDHCLIGNKIYKFPPEVREAIVAYDHDNVISPMNFTLVTP